MATENVRRYNVSDAEMLSEARNFSSQLFKHIDTFSGFDGITFTNEYVANFSALIKETEELPTDNVLIDIMANSTQEVSNTVQECYEEITYTKYYVKKLFKDNQPVMNQFGYNDLKNIRKSSDKMIRFMEDFISVVTMYETKMVGVGYPEGKKETLITLNDKLKSQRNDQKTIKKERPVKTVERVHKLNDVWDVMTQISEAAGSIFKSEQELRNIFLLPTHSVSNKNGSDDSSENDSQDVTE